MEGMTLPITRRGLFSQDDFFSRFQNDFSSAVDDVLNRWESKSSKADRFASYRRLRERDASEDSIAATISDTGDAHVIVIDMSEFASGQISVQTVQCSAVIEGKCGSKIYKKQFALPPNTDLERVVADMSDENILTVTAPRKSGKVISINTDSSESSAKPDNTGASSLEAQIIPSDTQTTLAASSSTIQQATSGTAPLAAAPTGKTEALASVERRSSQSRIIPLNIESETCSQAQTVSSGASSTSEVVTERIIPTVVGQQMAIHTTHHNRVLPINRRGKFFQDRSFERVWKDFETAIDELVERKGSTAGMEQNKDRFQSYRNLRKVVQQDDNQAAKVAKESNECKIVVDVKDFVDGHLDVKAVQGAVIVSGRKGPCSFERRFSIAGLTQPEKVSAAISTDGVLTITAPL
ncbi:hypothetical protein SK128_015793 [Halocaridina rubra]|uniref:SHSP domain-containing protein n=1 Tax=Halocaridina rubra TaxID=373956 RepID=A0AAN9A0L7_HALRR